jgi:succinate dehydrogenase/fumarate reductase flavoprotein subunit
VLPNPSEMQRLEEEYEELKKEFKECRLKYPKGYLEGMLRDLRRLENFLDIPEEKRANI